MFYIKSKGFVNGNTKLIELKISELMKDNLIEDQGALGLHIHGPIQTNGQQRLTVRQF